MHAEASNVTLESLSDKQIPVVITFALGAEEQTKAFRICAYQAHEVWTP
jgi:hypothetical protein